MSVRGIILPHMAEERLAKIVSDSVAPKLLPEIDVMAWRRTHVGIYDAQPLPDLNSEAMDFRVASESFTGYSDLGKWDLETLRLVMRFQGPFGRRERKTPASNR